MDSTSLPVPNLTHGLRDDPIELRSTTSAGEQPAKVVSTVEEYRNVQRQNTSSRKARWRVHRGNKTPQKSHTSLPVPSSAEVGPAFSSQSHGSQNHGPRSLDNPDDLALNSPVAGTAPYVNSREKRPSQGAEINTSEPPLKKTRRMPAEMVESSEDELQRGTPSRLARPSCNIRPTVFGPHAEEKEDTTRSTQNDAIHVRKAAAGRHFLDSETGCPIRLCSSSDGASYIGVVSTPSGTQEHHDWLRVVKKSVGRIEYAAVGSCFVNIRRSGSETQPSRLYLEFSSIKESQRFLQSFSENLVDKEPDLLAKTFRAVVKEIENYNDRTPQNLEIASANVQNHSAHSTVDLDALKDDAIATPTPNIIRKGRTSAHFAERKDRRVITSSPVRTRASASYTNAAFVLDVNHTNEKWSKTNPDWHKKWHGTLSYPLTGRAMATVVEDDIQRLDDGEFLNDSLIQFYLSYLQFEKSSENAAKIYIFSSFFFNKLSSKGGKIDYEGVKRWTSKIDLFSYDYVVIPVNENLHWYLAIICNPSKALPQASAQGEKDAVHSPEGLAPASDATSQQTLQPWLSSGGPQQAKGNEPKIMTLDSLGEAHGMTCKALRSYLAEEAKDKKGVELQILPTGMTAKGLPEQQNYCDCGIFVLAYMEEFLKNPDKVAGSLLQRKPYEWDIRPSDLRNSIRDLLFELQTKQQLIRIRERREKREAKKSRSLEFGSAGDQALSSPIRPSQPLETTSVAPRPTTIPISKLVETTAQQPSCPDQPQIPQTPSKPATPTAGSPRLTKLLSSSSSGGSHEKSCHSAHFSGSKRASSVAEGTVSKSACLGDLSFGPGPTYVQKLPSSESDGSPRKPSIARMLGRSSNFKPPEKPHDPFHRAMVGRPEADGIIPSVETDGAWRSKSGATYDGINYEHKTCVAVPNDDSQPPV